MNRTKTRSYTALISTLRFVRYMIINVGVVYYLSHTQATAKSQDTFALATIFLIGSALSLIAAYGSKPTNS